MVSLAAIAQRHYGSEQAGTAQAVRSLQPEAPVSGGAGHQPVLLHETVEHLAVWSGGVYCDGTLGGGGHASAILEASAPAGVVLGIELDPRSLSRARRRLAHYGKRFVGVAGNYRDAPVLARANGVDKVDGFLLDLGFSSLQVDTPGYGLSFQRDEPLDMQYDPAGGAPNAHEIINSYEEGQLARIFGELGEDPHARRIAREVVRRRPLNTTGELAALVAGVVRPGRSRRVNPATRVFQALRIAANNELDNLAHGLDAAVEMLKPGGRLAVISYHSLEDRLVKNAFARFAARCICPPELPQCVCRHTPQLGIVNRRIIRPGPEESAGNPRSRSARLRVAQRL